MADERRSVAGCGVRRSGENSACEHRDRETDRYAARDGAREGRKCGEKDKFMGFGEPPGAGRV